METSDPFEMDFCFSYTFNQCFKESIFSGNAPSSAPGHYRAGIAGQHLTSVGILHLAKSERARAWGPGMPPPSRGCTFEVLYLLSRQMDRGVYGAEGILLHQCPQARVVAWARIACRAINCGTHYGCTGSKLSALLGSPIPLYLAWNG